MVSKRIVIISAAIYPRNSPRANRTTELAKEFARQGHDVTVYAVLGKYDYTEFEKENNLKVRNLGKMNFVPYTSDVDSEPSYLNDVFTKLFFKILEYPNIEFFFKVVRVLKKEQNIDLLLTFAVPFPIHWGAAYEEKHFAKKNIKTWIADCGDPYMGNKLKRYPFYFKYVEKWFCKKVDYLTVPIEAAKDAYYEEFLDKIRVIPQGFNLEEIKITDKINNTDVVTFVYAGVFYKDIRDPRPFLDYLCELNNDFRFIVYTKNESFIENYKKKLGKKLLIRNYIPREELLNVMSQADFLINFENDSEVQSPSKLIDYALSKRPILSVSSSRLNKDHISEFLNRNYTNQVVIKDIEQYNIKNVARTFISLMEK